MLMPVAVSKVRIVEFLSFDCGHCNIRGTYFLSSLSACVSGNFSIISSLPART
jgi:hypothetical protein